MPGEKSNLNTNSPASIPADTSAAPGALCGAADVPQSQPNGDSALLPCPFCGEKRIYLNKPGFNYSKGSINCPACMVVMPGEVNEAELVGCWNTRAPAVATGGEPVAGDLPDALGWLLDAIKSEVTHLDDKPLLKRRFAVAEKVLLAALPPAKAAGDVRAAVIEECALVAERHKWSEETKAVTNGARTYGNDEACDKIAKTIRALAQAPATDAAGGQS